MTMQTVQWRGALRTGDEVYCRGHIVTLVERTPVGDWKVTGGNLPALVIVDPVTPQHEAVR